MTAATQPQNHAISAIVKQVLSGDTIVIRGVPQGGPPKEKTITLSFITAPKLARRGQTTPEDPYAWEARELLRKKLVGQSVYCSLEKSSNPVREYGTVFLGHDNTGENINELLVREGLVTVKGDNMRSPPPEITHLLELQDAAKSAQKGMWGPDTGNHRRTITWTVESMDAFLDSKADQPIKAIIEHVRDGSTIRACLLPDFVHITLMMTGIKSPQFKLDKEGKPDTETVVEYAEEAKFFTESRLLQREVEILLESVNGSSFVGTVIHPKGNIAEELLKNGLAQCVDWSIAKMKKADQERLRLAEKGAKGNKLRLWKNWSPPPPISDSEFVGTVVEVINGDALNVKLPNGNVKKIFLASIRPPRLSDQTGGEKEKDAAAPKASGPIKRQLYEVPWMFEAREYLRKKLIGKKVSVSVDYIQPARDSMPEKVCCTVTIASQNVAEALVSRGLATVVRYRQDDDQRASAYDAIRAAEVKAIKSLKGVHAKKDIPLHRVNDLSGDSAKAKALLPHIKRTPRVEALVEYVASGSRLRIFLPKESCLVTFLLSGIDLKGARDDGQSNEELALAWTKERCLQREVEVRPESCDRAGNFIGWMWAEGVNISVGLVEAGLAKVHASGEGSEFAKEFANAKNTAKANGMWKFIESEEVKEEKEDDRIVERKVDYREVVITHTAGGVIFAQNGDQSGRLVELQAKLNQDLKNSPPLPGSYNPKKGEFCAAVFEFDNAWYRAKVERPAGSSGSVTVLYIDYGNSATIPLTKVAPLPSGFDPKVDDRPFASPFTLVGLELPLKNEDYLRDFEDAFYNEVMNKTFLMNIEVPSAVPPQVSLVHPGSNENVAVNMIKEGRALAEQRRRERRLQKLMDEYQKAEEEAKKKRLNIWQYGDVREDDDKEFGAGR